MNTGEVIALIKAFGGGGGGSSGGGVLVVNLTWNEDNSASLDKTWQEIHNADAVVICETNDNEKKYYNLSAVSALRDFVSGDTYYYVVAYMLGENSRFQFKASSASGYPVYVDA